MFVSRPVGQVLHFFVTIIEAGDPRGVGRLPVGLDLADSREVVIGDSDLRGPPVGVLARKVGDGVPHDLVCVVLSAPFLSLPGFWLGLASFIPVVQRLVCILHRPIRTLATSPSVALVTCATGTGS